MCSFYECICLLLFFCYSVIIISNDKVTYERTLRSEAIKKKREGVWSNEIGHVHGHLINLSVVELLNILQHALVFTSYEVDGYSFAAKSATTTNPVSKCRHETVSCHSQARAGAG